MSEAPRAPHGQVTFESRFPSHQNAIDLFGDRWMTRIEEFYPGVRSGPEIYLGPAEHRPTRAANQLGFVRGSLHGMRVLEIGPMEGAHTYQLAKLGAESILAIEANSEAYLRSLVMKEILRTPNAQFLLGDALRFLQESETRFDLIFCSGVLYHMSDPFALIEAMARRTDRIFLWTHYYDPDDPKGPEMTPAPVVRDGLELTYFQHAYGVDKAKGPFWGGAEATVAWMKAPEILRAFEHFGMKSKALSDQRNFGQGHHLTAVFIRNGDFNPSPAVQP